MAKTAIIEKAGGPEEFKIVDMLVGDPGPDEISITVDPVVLRASSARCASAISSKAKR